MKKISWAKEFPSGNQYSFKADYETERKQVADNADGSEWHWEEYISELKNIKCEEDNIPDNDKKAVEEYMKSEEAVDDAEEWLMKEKEYIPENNMSYKENLMNKVINKLNEDEKTDKISKN